MSATVTRTPAAAIATGRGEAKTADATATGRGEAKAAAAAKKPSLLKSKKGIVAVVAVLAVGGGAYKMLAPTKVGAPTGGDVVTMDPTTVNLAGGHYLQVAVAIQLVKGKASASEFQTSHASELVIDRFSGLQATSLQKAATRDTLHDELEAALKKAYPDEVYDMFFTKFVTQ